eukprot:1952725-Pyramimonas_sp.AAC.1
MSYQVPLRHLRAHVGFVSLMCCFPEFAGAYHLQPDEAPNTDSYREVHRVVFSDGQKYASTDARSANLGLVDADQYQHE